MLDRDEVEAIVNRLQPLNRTDDQDLDATARRVLAKSADIMPELRADELDDRRFVVSIFGTPAAAEMRKQRFAVLDNRGLTLCRAISGSQPTQGQFFLAGS